MTALPSTPRTARQAGFTLIELMIAVAVVALLMSIALPSFMDSFRKGRRSDAVAGIAAVQQAQERWRSSNPNFTTSFSQLQLNSTNSPRGFYTLAVTLGQNTATDYEVIATAVGAQANDTNCAYMGIRVLGADVQTGSGSSGVSYPDTNRCWAK